MSWKICWHLVLVIFQTICAKDPELPLCPTNIAFLPQNLPMHCKMVNGNTFNSPPMPMKSQQIVTYPPSIFQSPPPNKIPPMPFPIPPGFSPQPGFPPLLFPGPPGLPAPIFPPGMAVPPMAAIPAAVPIPMPGPLPQKLPVIVMPFYSPDPAQNKKKKKKKDSSESDSCSDDNTSDSSDNDGHSSGFWKPGKSGKGRKHKRLFRRSGGGIRKTHRSKDLLTPMIQYVNRDGYVIYEKEISKGEASDWLGKKEERRQRKGVTYTELDEIKHQLGEDNVVENYEEPKLFKLKDRRTEIVNHVTVVIPTAKPGLHRKKFKKVEDEPSKRN